MKNKGAFDESLGKLRALGELFRQIGMLDLSETKGGICIGIGGILEDIAGEISGLVDSLELAGGGKGGDHG